MLRNLFSFMPALLNMDVSYLWIEVDNTEVLILQWNKNNSFPQIHTHNSNKLLYK